MMKKKYERDKAYLEDVVEINNDTVINQRFTDVEFDEEMKWISFDNCEFINCTFKSTIKSCTFYNCLFEKCELSNILFVECGIQVSLFDKCHMVGTRFIESKLKYDEFNSTHMKYSIISGVDVNDSEFIECNMEQINISDTRFNKDVIFNQCKMIEMEVMDTSLSGVDVSSSNIEGMVISPDNVKGLIVNEAQAIDLIYLLGVVIK